MELKFFINSFAKFLAFSISVSSGFPLFTPPINFKRPNVTQPKQLNSSIILNPFLINSSRSFL